MHRCRVFEKLKCDCASKKAIKYGNIQCQTMNYFISDNLHHNRNHTAAFLYLCELCIKVRSWHFWASWLSDLEIFFIAPSTSFGGVCFTADGSEPVGYSSKFTSSFTGFITSLRFVFTFEHGTGYVRCANDASCNSKWCVSVRFFKTIYVYRNNKNSIKAVVSLPRNSLNSALGHFSWWYVLVT